MAPSDVDCHLYPHDRHHGCPGIIHTLPNEEFILFEESARIIIRTRAIGLKHVPGMFARALIFFDKKLLFRRTPAWDIQLTLIAQRSYIGDQCLDHSFAS